ncbi:hypothetical protein [Sphingomonas sp.]|jgi:hypothetical protein|uniref:hypothetical protein n=1 Tax=Sphingomonas sp. TaxID=28214 RepID=UPI0035C87746
MQTERVTFLTTPDHKATLDAFARESGMSVGHVVREATSRYVAESELDEDGRFKLLIQELDAALPEMHAALDRAINGQRTLRAEIDAMLREAGLRA